MDTNDKKPLVSVRLMTYNHAPFIREAMDGIMMQETNFPVEVVVGDDFSTDGTLDIIREYKDTENIRIKILEREVGDEYWKKRQVKGRLYNFTNILENCTGKYIALLDGDDYWTDPKKLQKQVDFLEENEDYSFCFHWVNRVKENGTLIKNNVSPANFYKGEVEFSPERILAGPMIINTCSLLFRNTVFIKEGVINAPNLPFADKTLEKLLALQGSGFLISESMADFRKNSLSVTSSVFWRGEVKPKGHDYHVLLYTYLEAKCKEKELLNIIKLVKKRSSLPYSLNWIFSKDTINLIYIYANKNFFAFLFYFIKHLYNNLELLKALIFKKKLC